MLTCRTDAGGATLRSVPAGAGAAAPAGQVAAGGGQEGFSLPELLAALAASSLLLTVALHLFPSLQRSVEGAMLQLRLMRQLDLCALAIAKDVRRAGFLQHGGTAHTLWIDKRQGEPPGSCLVVGYDYYYARSDAPGRLTTATFGYRLRRGALETQRDINDCQGAGWEKVFNSDALTVTRLRFTTLPGGALRIHLAATARHRPEIGYVLTQIVARRNG